MIINKFICDNCGKEDFYGTHPVTLSCGYGSIFDGMELQFCCDECCIKFIQDKLNEVKEKGSYNLGRREVMEKKINDLIKDNQYAVNLTGG